MKASNVTISKYNPRKMSKDARKALKKSIEEFSDISGITINSKTNNVISGNHRWEELSSKYKKLELQNVFEDRYAIMGDGVYSGFMARVVNWSLNKEKQANIMANSNHVTGEWSSSLQNVLQEIALETDSALMDSLRLSEMLIDVSVTDDDLDLEKDQKREKTAEKKEDYSLDDDETPTHSEVREIVSLIKISVPSEHKDEITEIIMKALSKKEYYEEITIH